MQAHLQMYPLGWTDALQQHLELLREAHQNPLLQPARVLVEHRGAYEVVTATGPHWAEATGRLRHDSTSRLDLPAVGDWVTLDAEGRITALLPRTSTFVRRAAGLRNEPQVIAVNIDHVFIVTSANSDFNPRRIERYVAGVREGKATPVLVINKTDLCDDVGALIATLGSTATDLPIVCVSAITQNGGEALRAHLGPQITIALVGSSGVGKSTLVNWLLGSERQLTSGIREQDDRGQHTTTHRELLPLSGGGALIDTPGMREFALWSEQTDLSGAFADIELLLRSCRFGDCQHRGQPGCAVGAALESGELDPERLANFFKLQRELTHQNPEQRQAAQQRQTREAKQRARATRQKKRGPDGGKL
jgi:ribosome biogenesis GTPase